ncbi:MAG TPA: helix-hairpin-helix domain-containing protein [Thermoguttaceae bacterium]|nr:helix-hairpin-helix domain-containing protein [Thermoguttaceae bacterium]
MSQEPIPVPVPTDAPPRGPLSPWLRRADQCAVALLVALGVLGTVAWWWSHGGPRGDLVEFERLEPQEAKFLVDLNRAEWPELAQLPRMGETLARRIIESREKEGPFRRVDDLRRVKGIGPKTLERLRPYLLPLNEPT